VKLNVLRECGEEYVLLAMFTSKMAWKPLSPSRRRKRTLEVIATANPNSRLACQALVIGEGIVVEVPSGMHVARLRY